MSEYNRYYDRQGNPMSNTMAWVEKLEDPTYRRVEETTLPNGRLVSTICLGLNYRFGDGPPLIFETMVFPSEGDYGKLDSARYSTEEEANAGHAAMCAKWEKEP